MGAYGSKCAKKRVENLSTRQTRFYYVEKLPLRVLCSYTEFTVKLCGRTDACGNAAQFDAVSVYIGIRHR